MYLIDTNVISETAKINPNKNLAQWFSEHDETKIFLSALTLGEIRIGIEKLKDFSKKQKILSWLENDVIKRFCGRIINIDVEIADKWGYLAARLNIQPIDILIGASAIVHNLKLVTRNVKDFKNIAGLEIVNPWDNNFEP